MEKRIVRSCTNCGQYAVGCEEKCPFELQDESLERGSLLKKRKAMKVEKSNGISKFRILVSSAEKGKGQKNKYDVPKTGYVKAKRNLKKQEKRRQRRVEKNRSSRM